MALPVLAWLIAATACDPCAGTASCHTEERVSYTGHMVRFDNKESVPGTALTFVRTGGVELAADTVRATSGSDGFFTIESDALGTGIVVGTLHVAPPGRPPFEIAGLELRTTTRTGDGGTFGRIVVDPYLLHVIQLIDPATGAPLGVPSVATFRRTSGIHAEPEAITQSVPAGVFHLAPLASEPGVIYGELTVEIPSWGATYTFPLAFATHPFDAPPYEWDNLLLPR